MTSGVVSCGFGSAVLETCSPRSKSTGIYIRRCVGLSAFCHNSEGEVLKIVLGPLGLGSRYRLFESNGSAGSAMHAVPNVLVPILTRIYGIDTHSLPHCTVHYLGLSLFNPKYCTSLFSVLLASHMEHPIRFDYTLPPPKKEGDIGRPVRSTHRPFMDALEYL